MISKRWRRFTRCFGLLAVMAMPVNFPLDAFAQVAEQNRPDVGKYVKAYKGGEGITVWTTRLGKPDEHKALIQFSGAENAYDMRILAADVEQTGKDSRYAIDHNGGKFVVFIVSDGAGELYLPGSAESVRVYYNEDASRQGNSDHFLTEYLDQKN